MDASAARQPQPAPPRLLFVLKHREQPWSYDATSPDGCAPAAPEQQRRLSSGLHNSARFVVDMLRRNGVAAELVHVADNNAIDREVARYKPTLVVVEALWVVPEKFGVLTRLHPRVTWVIRNHSNLPFLANEGIAMDWLVRYAAYDRVLLSCNDERANGEVRAVLAAAFPSWPPAAVAAKCVLLPNHYAVHEAAAAAATRRALRDARTAAGRGHHRAAAAVADVGCFGAVRPLKNQLLQAVAAVRFADAHGLKLRFHVNASRLEDNGSPVLKNLRQLFAHLHASRGHELVQHDWLSHADFLQLLATMDVTAQVSFTETFNIVTADAVAVGVPAVVSPEVRWAPPATHADPTACDEIAAGLAAAWARRGDAAAGAAAAEAARGALHAYLDAAERTWLAWLGV
jgi:hypothetical protein